MKNFKSIDDADVEVCLQKKEEKERQILDLLQNSDVSHCPLLYSLILQ